MSCSHSFEDILAFALTSFSLQTMLYIAAQRSFIHGSTLANQPEEGAENLGVLNKGQNFILYTNSSYR